VVVLVVVAFVEVEAAAFAALASAELLASQAAVLVRPTQSLEEQPTVEVESASAHIILRPFSTLRLDPPMCVRLSHRDLPRCRVRADVRLQA
jgi:hypothetical protein